ncbi:MAG TPA: 4-hydroxy-3-methylbut-2-enyl diphosphate reductase [Williamwhitmania sp.]|nr:4-hydroxy-3-methylbut-2-enyl diphosphate reductase [Williamwhitmania sp.]
MVVDIDSGSGFCFGVVKAIEKAESLLSSDDRLFCLGEIVHNGEEVHRLLEKGLITVNHNEIGKLAGKKLLLRAHGEPPSTYKQAKVAGVELVDATCPIVLKLQQRVADAYVEMKNVGGHVVIYGKRGHPEVLGLAGNAGNEAIIIGGVNDVVHLDFSHPMVLFSQTTMDAEEYQILAEAIRSRLVEVGGDKLLLKVVNSVCGSVSNRRPQLKVFAQAHDVVIFVAGQNSSNGKVLFEVCKAVNAKTIFVESPSEIHPEFFANVSSVGVCGATSTPLWLMEQVAEAIRKMVK